MFRKWDMHMNRISENTCVIFFFVCVFFFFFLFVFLLSFVFRYLSFFLIFPNWKTKKKEWTLEQASRSCFVLLTLFFFLLISFSFISHLTSRLLTLSPLSLLAHLSFLFFLSASFFASFFPFLLWRERKRRPAGSFPPNKDPPLPPHRKIKRFYSFSPA